MDTQARKQQMLFCEKHNLSFCPALESMKAGISSNLLDGILKPIHGLRHPPEGDTTGWYIWAGVFSDDDDFFIPIHIKHLYTEYPELVKFLGMPPGFRFLIGEHGYEDIWEDKSLLDI